MIISTLIFTLIAGENTSPTRKVFCYSYFKFCTHMNNKGLEKKIFSCKITLFTTLWHKTKSHILHSVEDYFQKSLWNCKTFTYCYHGYQLFFIMSFKTAWDITFFFKNNKTTETTKPFLKFSMFSLKICKVTSNLVVIIKYRNISSPDRWAYLVHDIHVHFTAYQISERVSYLPWLSQRVVLDLTIDCTFIYSHLKSTHYRKKERKKRRKENTISYLMRVYRLTI